MFRPAAMLLLIGTCCSWTLAGGAPRTQTEPTGVLLIDGDPGKEGRPGETLYFKTLLEIKVPGADDSFSVSERQALDLADAKLPRLDAIVLCNVAELSEAQSLDLEVFLKRGGGVLIFLGDQVDPQKYNRVLYRDGKGPLPAKLNGVATLEGATVDFEKVAYPALKGLAKLGAPKIQKAYSLEVPKSEQVRSVAVLSTGEPLMVEKQVGRGKCLLVATTCDTDWNKLPLSPVFVPLVIESIRAIGPKPAEQR